MNIVPTKDHELVARLNEEVQNIHAELFPAQFKPYAFEEVNRFLARLIDSPGHIFLVGEWEGEYVGYAWIELKEVAENAFRRSYRSVYVHQIAVLEPHRKQGYGLRLLEKIEQIAADAGIGRIELDYWSDNRPAQRFYRNCGFEVYREFVYKQL